VRGTATVFRARISQVIPILCISPPESLMHGKKTGPASLIDQKHSFVYRVRERKRQKVTSLHLESRAPERRPAENLAPCRRKKEKMAMWRIQCRMIFKGRVPISHSALALAGNAEGNVFSGPLRRDVLSRSGQSSLQAGQIATVQRFETRSQGLLGEMASG
jgi:hypothetical protein